MKLPLSLCQSITSLLLLTNLAGHVLAARPGPGAERARQMNSGRKAETHSQYNGPNEPKQDSGKSRRAQSSSSCGDTPPAVIQAPKENVWYGLTGRETADVAKWLFGRLDLNLTATANAGEWDNTIALIELQRPNKSDTLLYLDGNGPVPPRYAYVRLNNRATVDPYYADILVGPLPISRQSTWQPLEFPFTRKTQGQVRNAEPDSVTVYSEWLFKIGASIADITQDLWNGTAVGLETDTLDIWGIDPVWQDNGRIIRWDTFWNKPSTGWASGTLLPLGLYLKSDVTGRDPAKWTLLGWMYNDVFYETTEQFRRAYWSPGFTKLSPNVDGPWAHTDQAGPALPMDQRQPPSMVAPNGARYSVDAQRNYVSWMDFSFYIGFNRDTGVSLFDIKYKGQRVLYELGLQEALSHYASNDPVQSSMAHLDTFYGFGPYTFELLKGYDCPSYATYLNTSFYEEEETHTHLNSLCLFEFDADFPLSRHSTPGSVSVTKNVYFTLRTISTIGNYDYMTSYTFHMDGTMGIEVRASGYIQAAYYANNQDYGYQIHDALSGTMHDHVLNFKADFDILGTANTVELVSIVPVRKTFPWSGDQSRNTMQLSRSMVESEDTSRLNWGSNAQTQINIINQDMKNTYGEYRGYRILPSLGTSHLSVLDSSNLANAAHWAEYDVQITRQHDTEPSSSHPYNNQDTYNPPVDFGQFFNSESLHQEDLIVWLNLGMHHIPHTGDIPNTVFTTAHSGVTFMPLNYLLSDPSRETVNMVRVDYTNGAATNVEMFGQDTQSCDVHLSSVENALWGYRGDVIVRKFPYDPNHPFYAEGG